MHPSLVLCFWFCVVLLAQRLPIAALLPALALAVGAAGRPARRAWARLAYRSRWLLAVLTATFGLMTPGESAWPGAGVTIEGLVLALDHLSRLVAVLFAVAWYVAGRSVEQVVAALWGIAAALRLGGAQRAVVRLALTLRLATEGDGGRRTWRAFLDDAPTDAPVPVLRVDLAPLAARDLALGVGAVAATAVLWRWLP